MLFLWGRNQIAYEKSVNKKIEIQRHMERHAHM